MDALSALGSALSRGPPYETMGYLRHARQRRMGDSMRRTRQATDALHQDLANGSATLPDRHIKPCHSTMLELTAATCTECASAGGSSAMVGHPAHMAPTSLLTHTSQRPPASAVLGGGVGLHARGDEQAAGFAQGTVRVPVPCPARARLTPHWQAQPGARGTNASARDPHRCYPAIRVRGCADRGLNDGGAGQTFLPVASPARAPQPRPSARTRVRARTSLLG